MSHEILAGATHNTDTVVCLLAPAFYQMAFERSAWEYSIRPIVRMYDSEKSRNYNQSFKKFQFGHFLCILELLDHLFFKLPAKAT